MGAYSDLHVLLNLFHRILSPSIIFTSITQYYRIPFAVNERMVVRAHRNNALHCDAPDH